MEAICGPGGFAVGALAGELIEAAGQTGDGAALCFAEPGVLCCGDYLSDVEIPLVSAAGDPGAYAAGLGG